jgi:dimeric dUTPase (all-alpha-NTP-PPase superfamily)
VTITSDTPYTFSDYSVSFHSASLSVDPTTTTTLSTTSTTTTSTPTVSITYTVTGPSHPEATLAHSFKELAKEVRAFKEWSLNIDTDIDYFYKNGIQKSDLLYDYKQNIDALSANLTRTNRFLHTFRGIYNNTIHVLEDGFETLGSRIQDVSERFDVLESQTHTDIPPIYQKIEAVEAENTELREKLDELLGRESVSNDAVEERLGAIEAENAELREKLDQLLSQQVVPHDIVEEAPQPVEKYPEEQPEEEHVEAVIPEEPQPKEQYWPDWFEGEWNGED